MLQIAFLCVSFIFSFLKVEKEESERQESEKQEEKSTYHIKQRDILANVDVATATKHFNLELDHGPYFLDYSRNGRHLLIGGKDGHLAAFDWQTKHLHTEVMVSERIGAVRCVNFYCSWQPGDVCFRLQMAS